MPVESPKVERRPYTKPEVTKVELIVDDAVMGSGVGVTRFEDPWDPLGMGL